MWLVSAWTVNLIESSLVTQNLSLDFISSQNAWYGVIEYCNVIGQCFWLQFFMKKSHLLGGNDLWTLVLSPFVSRWLWLVMGSVSQPSQWATSPRQWASTLPNQKWPLEGRCIATTSWISCTCSMPHEFLWFCFSMVCYSAISSAKIAISPPRGWLPKLVLYPAVRVPWQRMSDGLIWISCHERVSGKCIIIVLKMQLSDLFSICWSICCVALPSSHQQHSLTIKASVTSERSGKLPDFSH